MEQFPKISDEVLSKMLEPPHDSVDIVLDTDAYNEVDDQFAIAYAFLSPGRINVKALYAAPFFNARSKGPKDGMEKSYDEIFRILGFLGLDGKGTVFKGSESFLTAKDIPAESPAAEDLIKKARAYSKERPLYVVAIGALTNIASAILAEPSIIEKIVVVWLGGHSHGMPHTREFNMKGDIFAAQMVFDSGAPLVQLPCMGVVSELYVSAGELNEKLQGKSELGTYLSDIVESFMIKAGMERKVIWDVSIVAYLINPRWVKSENVPCPIIEDDLTYSFDPCRHIIRVATEVDRNMIFADLLGKIANMKKGERA